MNAVLIVRNITMAVHVIVLPVAIISDVIAIQAAQAEILLLRVHQLETTILQVQTHITTATVLTLAVLLLQVVIAVAEAIAAEVAVIVVVEVLVAVDALAVVPVVVDDELYHTNCTYLSIPHL